MVGRDQPSLYWTVKAIRMVRRERDYVITEVMFFTLVSVLVCLSANFLKTTEWIFHDIWGRHGPRKEPFNFGTTPDKDKDIFFSQLL